MKQKPPRPVLFLFAVGAMLAVWPQLGLGQIRITNPVAGEVTSIFPPVPRELRQHLTSAKQALQEQRYADAVELLGRLLAWDRAAGDSDSDIGEHDYFLGDPAARGTLVSLKAEAQRLLGSMPEQGRGLYELKFGADARQLLNRALASGDMQQLSEVTRRYFHTEAGYEATLLIGRMYLDQGRPLAAALRFQRLADSEFATGRYEPELSVLLATSWILADMPQRARAVLEGLSARVPGARLRVGAQEVALFDPNDATLTSAMRALRTGDRPVAPGVDRLMVWLQHIVGPALEGHGREATQWTLFRGDAARNAQSAGGMALFSPRWRVQTANHPNDEDVILQTRRQYTEQGIPAIPTLYPLAVSNVIVMRSPRRLYGVDFETGKRVWEFPWYEAPGEEELLTESIATQQPAQSPQTLELSNRVWDDAPYGQLSSDGEQVFALWGLSANTPQRSVLIQPFGIQRPNEGNAESNRLVALDLKTQGKLRWIVGDEDGTDEPELAGAFFLGAPLPLMGQLFVLAEINEGLRLVVLDPKTGRLQWSQQLAYVDARGVRVDPIRRAAGATPSFSDGVLICPTSCGAVVAVDASTRSLLWGYQYPLDDPRQSLAFAYRNNKELGERWTDSSVTISEGRVLLTPVESDKLFCLDLLTGEEVWAPQDRGDLLFIGCVSDGRVILAGKQEVRAISLADARVLWTCGLPAGMPSGRGFLAAGHYYLPTTANQLLKISLADGAIVENVETDTTLGNLVAYRDQIVSQGTDWLATYYQLEPLQRIVAARLAENQQDSWALARQAELLLHDDRHAEALEVFQRAYQLDPQDDAIRSSLVRSLLSALNTDFAAHRRFADKLESLISQPDELAEFQRSMAVGLKQVGEFRQAADYFIRLTALDGTGEFGTPQADLTDMVRVTDQLTVHRSRWLRVQIEQLIQAAGTDVQQSIHELIQTRYDEISATGSISRLRRFAEHFGDHPLGLQAKLQLARKLLDTGQILAAELELIGLQNSTEAPVAATATGLLMQLMLDHARPEEAAQYAQQLATRWSDVPTLEGPTGQQLAERALAQEAVRQWTDQPLTWRHGRCETEKLNRRTLSSYSRVIPIHVNEIRGSFPRHHTVVFNQNKNAIVVTDSLGRQTNQVLLGERLTSVAPGTMSVFGHLLVVNIGFSVMAVDTLRGLGGEDDVLRWSTDLGGGLLPNARTRPVMSRTISRTWGPQRIVPTDNTQRPLGMIGPVTPLGLVMQKSQELTCVDPLTGTPIWIRSGITPGCDIFGDELYTFVVPPESSEAIVLLTADGSEVGRRHVGARSDRWVTAGRHVLTCRDIGQQLELRYFDAWQQQDVWKRLVDDQSQCWQPTRDEVAVFQPNGDFFVLQLPTGQAQVECQLPAPPSLNRLYVLPGHNSYTVVASGDRPPDSENSMGIYGTIGSDLCPEINGYIYTVDTATGQPRWQDPAKVYEYYMPLDQPSQAPTLVFIQNVRTPMPNVPNRIEYKASIVVMDKRDGRQLYAENDLDRLLTYAVQANPEQQQVVLQTNTNQFTFTFTDQPAEPAGPLQMDAEVPAASAAAGSVGKTFSKILEAFIKEPQAKTEGNARPRNVPPPVPWPEAAPEHEQKPAAAAAPRKK